MIVGDLKTELILWCYALYPVRPSKDERITKNMPYKEVLLVRKSRLEEAKEKYGNDLEVIC